jgi:hypothetical protein
MQTEWEIQARSHQCNHCQRAFADKSPYRTVLTVEGEGYKRRDLCPNCWQQVAAMTAGTVVSQWQGIYKAPAPPAPEPIARNTAETKLRELIASTDPAHAGVRYILAVILERKKILRHCDTVKEDGRELLVYEHAESGEMFTLPDPHLRLDQLEQVQAQVAGMLGKG